MGFNMCHRVRIWFELHIQVGRHFSETRFLYAQILGFRRKISLIEPQSKKLEEKIIDKIELHPQLLSNESNWTIRFEVKRCSSANS